jgi:nicotinamidase-related amidase
MNKKALLVIDWINDFIREDGSLYLPGAEKLPIQDVVDEFSDRGDFTCFISDKHYIDDAFHPEYGKFPDHAIVNDVGRELYGVPDKHYCEISKRMYSGFHGTPLDSILRERNIRDVYLVGVCTEICVLHTAIYAYNLRYNITVYENCVQGLTVENHNFALDHMKNILGVEVIKWTK